MVQFGRHRYGNVILSRRAAEAKNLSFPRVTQEILRRVAPQNDNDCEVLPEVENRKLTHYPGTS